MPDVILEDIKKVLGLAADYTAFDVDVTMYINSAMSLLSELGVIVPEGFVVVEGTETWADLNISDNELGLVKPYIYLRVRMLFDPPTTSFQLDATSKLILEHEWRLTNNRETNPDTSYDEVEEVV